MRGFSSIIINLIRLLIILFCKEVSANSIYSYIGQTYDPAQIFNYGTCLAPSCVNFTSAMRVTGSFTVASSLAPNQTLNDISSQLISWTFNDGVNSLSSTGSSSAIYKFEVSTDSQSRITDVFISVANWQTFVGVNGYVNYIVVYPVSMGEKAYALNAMQCISMGSGNVCALAQSDGSSSDALTQSAGVWTSTTPTINSINPTTGSAVGGTTITITGTNLSGATAIIVGGSMCAPISINGAGTELTCTTSGHAVGQVDVIATTPNGTVTQTNGFTYTAAPTPPNPIPTLSEWAQIMMMLAMIATAGFYGWRIKQH